MILVTASIDLNAFFVCFGFGGGGVCVYMRCKPYHYYPLPGTNTAAVHSHSRFLENPVDKVRQDAKKDVNHSFEASM